MEVAEAIRSATGCVFSAVYTCPPDRPLEAQGAVSPEEHRAVIEGIVRGLLPRVEKTQDSAEEWSKRTRGTAYAPLDDAREVKLAERVRAEFLRPQGVEGLLTAYLMGSGGQVLGFIVVATAEPSKQALKDFGAELGVVATIGGQTAQAALALAEGFGARTARAVPEAKTLSDREREVVNLVAEGLADSEIAHRMKISEQTVGSHMKRIYAKLGVHSRAELLKRAGLR
jgi:DNA-binding CsgD family transcriptional regulator